jgi:hypothetical protein
MVMGSMVMVMMMVTDSAASVSVSVSVSASASATQEPLDQCYDYQQHHPSYRNGNDATSTRTTHAPVVYTTQTRERRLQIM